MKNVDFYSLKPFFDMVDGLQFLFPLQIRSYLEIGVNRGLSLRRVLQRYPELERVVLCDKWAYGTSSREYIERVIVVHDIRFIKKGTRLGLVVDRFFEHRRCRFWKIAIERDKWGTAVLIDSTRLEGSI